MNTAVILAGGRSSRSGRIHKGLRSLSANGDRYSWLEYQVQQLRKAGYQRIVLATGYRSRRLLAKSSGALQKHNPTPANGPFSTLLSALKGFNTGHTLLLPLDNPVPTQGTLHRLRSALKGNKAAKPCYAGKGGHPLLLSNCVVKKLKRVDVHAEEARLDKQLRLLDNSTIARVAVTTSNVLCNLNSEKQWHRYKHYNF
ncbi:nucleotidyltransferase family protein [Neptuniibacter sp.]|uniref:nucleotidyltransferase family protein n=1 Tax=Neptuniibacter sp. TaxID=1962643 RepID=UPI0026263D95|nr:nucleotidyltransferase family protein [Neptuniibacter sp.]MCP4596778.1 NTP transferase domain-containing protein [Neptuniibacter sp.]